jgi:6-pyruvoyltetrahydropterin/6-carboxytetrahydropterin synthase
VIALTRRYRFPAAHVLAQPWLSQAENERLYGKCANANGHGHNYGIEVTVAGDVDPETGVVADRERLDGLVQTRIVDRFAHTLLNDDPAFKAQVPTAEHIAELVHGELEGPIAEECGARLVRVLVVETRRNRFETGELR